MTSTHGKGPSAEAESERSDLVGQMAARRKTAMEIQAAGGQAFANDAPITHQVYDLPGASQAEVDALPLDAELQPTQPRYAVAGRLLQVMEMGKAKFLFIRGDRGAMLQLYVRAEQAAGFSISKTLDLGDIVWACGPLFRTRKGKRSLLVEDREGKAGLKLLSKALRPLPGKTLQEGDKATDDDWRYRQRYADMIVHPEVAEVFRKRAKIMREIRQFFDARGYVECETRMLLPTNGGAAARPFKTHMNVLNLDLNLRIATELDLKRLVVGGIERVYEIGRIFRNEGLSRFHNPEFTSIEFYQAYATYRDLMELTEDLLQQVCQAVQGATTIDYQEHKNVSLAKPFRRATLRELVKQACPDAPIGDGRCTDEEWRSLPGFAKQCLGGDVPTDYGQCLLLLFERFVEATLIQPTFVCEYPTSMSPLSRKSDQDPRFVDRFELFVVGKELANAFSELNDPDDQRERFVAQSHAKQRGDH